MSSVIAFFFFLFFMLVSDRGLVNIALMWSYRVSRWTSVSDVTAPCLSVGVRGWAA